VAVKKANTDLWMRVGTISLVVIVAALVVYVLLIVTQLYFPGSNLPAPQDAKNSPSQHSAQQNGYSTTAPGASALTPEQEKLLIDSTTAPKK
jgi:hypothetical protein